MKIFLKIAAALFALVLVAIGILISAHGYDLMRNVYGHGISVPDLAFVCVAAVMCFGGAYFCFSKVVLK
jgi:hypothetical protein